LPLQLENYKKAFNQIYLIIPETKLSIYEKYDDTIGLITFNSKENNSFNLKRKALINLEIDQSTLMTILHTNEYKSIVKKHFGYLPEMTSFSQFKICSELIHKIQKNELNKLFIAQIKNRGDNKALSLRYYKEFNQLFLALKMNQTKKNKMIDLLKTPLQH
ncbi:MAG: sce7726 family protein, partial [Lutibacter sp.]